MGEVYRGHMFRQDGMRLEMCGTRLVYIGLDGQRSMEGICLWTDVRG